MNLFFYLFAFVFGALVGSFLNVCICRLPEGESIVFPPSRCPGCGERIRPYDNIPIVSWLILRGKCRSCGGKISPQYPVVEFINGLLTLFLLLRFGPTLQFLALFLFVCALVTITFIDLEHQIIPDSISLPGIIVGLLFSFFLPNPGWLSSIIGIAVGGGSLLLVACAYHALTGNEGMGGGDIKLLAMMGAFCGWKAVPFIIFVSSLTGSVIGVTLMLVRKKDSKLAIPFGPFLALGAVVYLFFGEELISWYLEIGVPGPG